MPPEGSPLADAYLDMNGLKQVNNIQGHAAGDVALDRDQGQAYRLGGD